MSNFTLITGDMIEFKQGKINPLKSVGTISTEPHQQLFFIPNQAGPLIKSGKLHANLFNLTQLTLACCDDNKKDVIPVLIKHQGTLQDYVGLTVKQQFKIINYISADLSKGTLTTLLPQLINDPKLLQIQLDEVKQLCS